MRKTVSLAACTLSTLWLASAALAQAPAPQAETSPAQAPASEAAPNPTHAMFRIADSNGDRQLSRAEASALTRKYLHE